MLKIKLINPGQQDRIPNTFSYHQCLHGELSFGLPERQLRSSVTCNVQTGKIDSQLEILEISLK